MEYTREDLIQICQDSVVPYTKWSNRDSYSSQVGVSSIYQGLVAGIDYKHRVDCETIWISFEKPTEEQKIDIYYKYYLNIDSIDDYLEENEGSEMFYDSGINWNSDFLAGYLPTRKRLDDADGDDWY